MTLCFLFATLVVALDQFFKHWISRTLDVGAIGPEIIPGVLGLTHWENDGAMLNVLSGQQWLLAGIALLASVVLVIILLRYNEGFWGTLGLAAVLGGTVGNLLDRIFNDGKVIDMFRTLFVSFPIFNIADIFITLGFITFLIHFIALTVKAEKNEDPSSRKDAPRREPAYSEERPPVDPSVFESGPDVEPLHYEQTVQRTPVYAQQEQDYAPQETYVAAPEYYAPPQQTEPAGDIYSAPADDYSSITDTTPEVSITLEALEAELGSLDVDYDVDELLREYGIEDDDFNV